MESKAKPAAASVLDSVLTNRLRMKDLALLCALDDCRNLHQASEMVHISQPSATKMLQEIEHAFGFVLFTRHPRGMIPTDLGGKVLAYAKQTLAGLEYFAKDLSIKQKGGYGYLAIGAIMGAAPDLIANAILRLKAHNPLIHVQVLGETSDQILPMLELHKLDLAVGRFSSPLQHNQFAFEELKSEELAFVARVGHPLSGRTGLKLADLAEWPWVLQPMPNPTRTLLEQEFAANDMSTPANIVECNSIFAILQILQFGDAIALISEPVVRDHLGAKLLCRLPLRIAPQLPAFGILTQRNASLRPPAQAFVEALRAVAGESATTRKAKKPA
jgi:DNA-binding transcriptional LysR family regulator